MSRSSNTRLDPLDSVISKSRTDRVIRLPAKTMLQRASRDLSSDKSSTGLMKVQTKPITQNGRMSEAIQKRELFSTNGATVEVTVKAHKSQKKSKSREDDVFTWGEILKNHCSNENISNFHRFDPLRTVHFLAKELQSKVKHLNPDDSSLLDVISEMQHALKRIPQEVVSKRSVQPENAIVSRLTKGAATQAMQKKHQAVMQTTNCQTPNTWYLEPMKLQQHLEESSEKIEKACQQMESLCSKLKKEKDELEQSLKAERKNNNNLIKQVDDYKIKLTNSESNAELLKSRNDQLQQELQKLQLELKSHNTPSAHELKAFIEELQKYKAETEEENMQLKQQLQLAHMETEKYEAILQARDVQVKEIKQEMTQLQEVVNQQLKEFQNSPYPSDDKLRDTEIRKTKERKPNVEIRSKSKLLLAPSDKFSGDTSFISSDEVIVDETNASPKIPNKKRHIFKIENTAESADLKHFREKFNEIKNKALSCSDNNSTAKVFE